MHVNVFQCESERQFDCLMVCSSQYYSARAHLCTYSLSSSRSSLSLPHSHASISFALASVGKWTGKFVQKKHVFFFFLKEIKNAFAMPCHVYKHFQPNRFFTANNWYIQREKKIQLNVVGEFQNHFWVLFQ